MDHATLEGLVAAGGPTPQDYPLVDGMLEQLFKLPHDEVAPAVRQARQILSPTLNRDTMQGFALLKPHGYSGDFEIIDRIYQNWTSPDAHLERWDHYFHDHAAPTAVRNRKEYFINLVRELGDIPAAIFNVASGPGRDMLECLQTIATEHCFTCLDLDPKALAYSKTLCSRFAERIEFHRGSALRFQSTRRFDLIWSAGLFDYFDDRVFVATLRHLLPLLARGGECVIGNFSTANSSRPYMELIGNWHLNHRTPEQLRALALDAGVEPELIDVKQEALGVNLFLHMRSR